MPPSSSSSQKGDTSLFTWLNATLENTPLRITGWLWLVWWRLDGLFENMFRIGWHHDEHYFVMHEEVARQSMAVHGQLPAWNPYYCGGIPELANPQSEALSPDFLLRLVFGTEVGRRLTLFLFLFLLLEGTYRYARTLRMNPIGAVVGALAFLASNWFHRFTVTGWYNFVGGFALMPWALHWFETALRTQRWRYGVACAFAMAWIFMCAGTYTTPYVGLALATSAVGWSIGSFFRRRKKKDAPAHPSTARAPWIWLASIAALTVGLCAIRLLPMADIIVTYPRVWQGNETFSLAHVLQSLFDLPQLNMGIEGGSIGLVAVALTSLAITHRTGWRILVAAGVWFALCIGDHGPWSPHHWMEKIPIIKDLRAPDRMGIVVELYLALGLAAGLTQIERTTNWISTRVSTITGALSQRGSSQRGSSQILLAAMVVVVMFPWMKNNLERHPIDVPSFLWEGPIQPEVRDFKQARGNRWDAHIWPLISRGTLQCFEETPFVQSPLLRADLSQEEYTTAPNASVKRLHWSPNAITLSAKATTPFVVSINQNYHEAWTSNMGHIRSDQGLLTVHLPPGHHTLKLRFSDPLIHLGTAVSILSWLAIAWAYRRRRQRRTRKQLQPK